MPTVLYTADGPVIEADRVGELHLGEPALQPQFPDAGADLPPMLQKLLQKIISGHPTTFPAADLHGLRQTWQISGLPPSNSDGSAGYGRVGSPNPPRFPQRRALSEHYVNNSPVPPLRPEQHTRLSMATADLAAARALDVGQSTRAKLTLEFDRVTGALDDALQLIRELLQPPIRP